MKNNCFSVSIPYIYTAIDSSRTKESLPTLPVSTTTSSIRETMVQLKCCVVVPTYNNDRTLARVLNDILKYTDDIIVVNDGSTDTTSSILAAYPALHILTLPKNKGKGNALSAGFKKATGLGFDFVITIDSDGQHYPEDIVVFLDHLEQGESKNVLLIGSRNMAHSTVPKKSSFGNRFSNFWFWFETGIWLKDTQCGFRLYPLWALKDLKFYTTKFEFEIEAIVRAAWKGITVKNVPVKVLYDESERVSHYRPVKDFFRISLLNTWFVLVALCYIKPRDLFRRLKKKGLKRFFYEDFLNSSDPPYKKALSIALGIFIGLSPFWGFHTLLVISLSILFRLNKVIAFAFSNISLPPFIPFILYASVTIGQWVTGQEISLDMDEIGEKFELLKNLQTYIVGSLVLAIGSSLLIGLIAFVFLSVLGRRKTALQNG